MKVRGSCHCRAIRFEAVLPDAEPSLLDCNCSICSLSGFLHLIVPHADFVLIDGQELLTSYRFGSEQAEHLFCRICGVKSFYQPRSHPDSWSINFRCVEGDDRLRPNIVPFDGRDWEKSRALL